MEDALCPWCIADGKAAAKFDATFVDSEGFTEEVPEEMARVVCERTPGFCAWQTERWQVCCGEPAAFVRPAGLKEIRQAYPQAEGELMMFIVHELGISGGAARRMLESLRRDQSPTAFVFKCLHCDATPVYADSI